MAKHFRTLLCAALTLLLLGTATQSSPDAIAASEADTSDDGTITTVLYPGWNLIGWVGPETPTSELFEEIPTLRQVWSWDAEAHAYLLASRDRYADVPTLTPGMGLWLRLGGVTTVEWIRPTTNQGVLLDLSEGQNLLGWTGEDGASVADALARFGDDIEEVWHWDAEAQRYVPYPPGSGAARLATLARGQALRIDLAQETRWWERGTARPTFVFADDITAGQREEVRALFDSAIDVIAMRFGVHTTDFTVDVSNEHPTCAAGGGVIDQPFPGCRTAIPHEYFHILQDELAGGGGAPDWMNEGSADYAQHVYEQEIGVRQPRNPFFAVEQLTRTPGEVHDFDRRHRLLPYALGFIAAEWLTDHAGTESLVEFYRLVRTHDRWEDAFALTFGIELDDFYEAVEVYRHERAPLYPHLLDDRKQVIVTPLSAAATPVATEIRAEIANLTAFYNERFGAGPLDYTVYVVSEEAYPSSFVSVLGDPVYCTIGWHPAVIVISDCEVAAGYHYYSPDGRHYTKYINDFHINNILRDLAPPLSTLHLRRDGGGVFCIWGIFWLCQGVPEYAVAMYEDHAGTEDRARTLSRQVTLSHGTARPLSDFEGNYTTQGGYAFNAAAEDALFFLAAHWLVEHAGDTALLEYFRLLPTAQTVEEAFEGAFGLTFEEFYEQFEAYRETLTAQ